MDFFSCVVKGWTSLQDSALGSAARHAGELLEGVREVRGFLGQLGWHLSRIFGWGGIEELKIPKKMIRSGKMPYV